MDIFDEINNHFEKATANLWKLAEEKRKREEATLMADSVIEEGGFND